MKKLRKLEINPARLIKDEELVVLRGGYDGACCLCYLADGGFCLGAMAATSAEMCTELCSYTFGGSAFGRYTC